VRRPLDVARIAETLARRWVGEDNLRLERLRARWPALVGQTVARRTFPARIDGAMNSGYTRCGGSASRSWID
jgi:hypothetical protein